eukprot:CAMPEP_0176192264 /NCGR_PEP_ID=MMETSP0121_2-20121125/4883_1 /TAXON_ID=160619 /ORGANISM="Kryptoperidinium foliaceum, Strain CCMP 1326" /LENGTH=157 /DNA_ID=CAMNT_0017530949 /DNA_START=16 /DNA_END=489 /DNA_ORIENTATION=-
MHADTSPPVCLKCAWASKALKACAKHAQCASISRASGTLAVSFCPPSSEFMGRHKLSKALRRERKNQQSGSRLYIHMVNRLSGFPQGAERGARSRCVAAMLWRCVSPSSICVYERMVDLRFDHTSVMKPCICAAGAALCSHEYTQRTASPKGGAQRN